MIRRFIRASLVATGAITIFFAASLALAGKFNEKISVGDKAPAFKDLEGIDGERHGLEDFKKAKAVVIAFISNHCPFARAYEKRLIQFAKKYADRGVAFVAINSSTMAPDRIDKMKERAKKQGFEFPYLYDESQDVGRAFGASVTPQLFVLDGKRKIAYMGAFDDSEDVKRVEKRYVHDAVDALLHGNQPKVTETRPYGCHIPYND